MKSHTRNILIVAGLVLLGFFLWHFDVFTDQTSVEKPDDHKVIIVGAGAAGLSAARELEQVGIEYLIIEASDTYGGRLKASEDFIDVPLDLGAEWIHEDPRILEDITGKDDIPESVDIITYNPRELLWFEDGYLSDESQELIDYEEYKFKDTTWFDIFSQYVVPDVEDSIVYNRAVSGIDYAGDVIKVATVDGTTYQPTEIYEAHEVIVTVPVSVLQKEYIDFTPALPGEVIAAINRIEFSTGFKVFLEFDEKFYPEMLQLGPVNQSNQHEEAVFFDALFGKDTERHVLGVLFVGAQADPYVDLSDSEITQKLLDLIDEISDGKGRKHFMQSLVQNWTQEPYIQGAYTTETDDPYIGTLRTIMRPIQNRLFFAGSAYDLQQQGTVPGAYRTGVRAAQKIIDMYGL